MQSQLYKELDAFYTEYLKHAESSLMSLISQLDLESVRPRFLEEVKKAKELNPKLTSNEIVYVFGYKLFSQLIIMDMIAYTDNKNISNLEELLNKYTNKYADAHALLTEPIATATLFHRVFYLTESKEQHKTRARITRVARLTVPFLNENFDELYLYTLNGTNADRIPLIPKEYVKGLCPGISSGLNKFLMEEAYPRLMRRLESELNAE